METRRPNIECHGPIAEHDQACAVLHDKPAVYDLSTGVFQPSWYAQEQMGYRLVRADTAIKRLVLRLFFRATQPERDGRGNG